MISIIHAPVEHTLMLITWFLILNVYLAQLDISVHQVRTDHIFVQMDIIVLRIQKTISISRAYSVLMLHLEASLWLLNV